LVLNNYLKRRRRDWEEERKTERGEGEGNRGERRGRERGEGKRNGFWGMRANRDAESFNTQYNNNSYYLERDNRTNRTSICFSACFQILVCFLGKCDTGCYGNKSLIELE
jgi:hypothetical protein